jgi:hypothetical protein
MKRWILFLLAGVFFLKAPSTAAMERFQAGLTFNLGFPQSDFKDNIDRLSLGGMGYFLYRLPESPFYVGLSAGVLVYGSETWTETFSPSFPEMLVDVRTQNYILLAHLVVRIQPQWDFRPYIEGLAGLSHFWTETSLYDSGCCGEDDFASAVNFSDTAMSYGAGAGIQFPLLRTIRQSGQIAFAMDADLGVRYIYGGRAEYLKEGSIFRENGDVYYDVMESATSLVTARAGISFRF